MVLRAAHINTDHGPVPGTSQVVETSLPEAAHGQQQSARPAETQQSRRLTALWRASRLGARAPRVLLGRPFAAGRQTDWSARPPSASRRAEAAARLASAAVHSCVATAGVLLGSAAVVALGPNLLAAGKAVLVAAVFAFVGFHALRVAVLVSFRRDIAGACQPALGRYFASWTHWVQGPLESGAQPRRGVVAVRVGWLLAASLAGAALPACAASLACSRGLSLPSPAAVAAAAARLGGFVFVVFNIVRGLFYVTFYRDISDLFRPKLDQWLARAAAPAPDPWPSDDSSGLPPPYYR